MNIELKVYSQILDKRLIVFSPFLPQLSIQAHKLSGKYLPEHKAWSYDPRNKKIVLSMYEKLYGQNGETSVNYISIKVTAKKDITAGQSPIYIGPRELCRAKGRDSTITYGISVALECGNCASGGSSKGWTTNIKKGSCFVIHDYAEPAIELINRTLWDITKLEIPPTESTNSLHALSAEKERIIKELDKLNNRLNQIDSILEGYDSK